MLYNFKDVYFRNYLIDLYKLKPTIHDATLLHRTSCIEIEYVLFSCNIVAPCMLLCCVQQLHRVWWA